MDELSDRVQALWSRAANPDADYYAFSIFLGDNGQPTYSCYSQWVGFDELSPRREIRQASLVDAEKILNTWRQLHQPGMVVDDQADLGIFFLVGGNAVVEHAVAQACLSDWPKPEVAVYQGEYGFASPSLLPATAMQRAPTAKLRMDVLKRDQYRCRICGRRASDHVDLELHVHHIRPWALGGITETANLITLCHTCHNGLDPHFEQALYRLMAGAERESAATYLNKLLAYENASARRFEPAALPPRPKRR